MAKLRHCARGNSAANGTANHRSAANTGPCPVPRVKLSATQKQHKIEQPN